MTTPVAERVVLDANVLLSASDEARRDHHSALAALNDWPAAGVTLYTSGQILREYLAVATRPAGANGLGMARADAVANVRALRGRLRLMAEHEKVADRLIELLEAVDCTGRQVHDANVVATMLTHGVGTVVTGNAGDFARFGDRIEVIALAG